MEGGAGGGAAVRWSRTTAARWVSFWPKQALSGPTALNHLATTVVTPRKCPGRTSPSSPLRPAPGVLRDGRNNLLFIQNVFELLYARGRHVAQEGKIG